MITLIEDGGYRLAMCAKPRRLGEGSYHRPSLHLYMMREGENITPHWFEVNPNRMCHEYQRQVNRLMKLMKEQQK